MEFRQYPSDSRYLGGNWNIWLDTKPNQTKRVHSVQL